MIELLTVIAIIAILASMLLPSLSRAREMARRTSCSSNLRQLNLGIQQYTQDYDERLPTVTDGPNGAGKLGGWTYYNAFPATQAAPFEPAKGGIFPYIKSTQIFVCPDDTNGQNNAQSYAINSCTMSDANGAVAQTPGTNPSTETGSRTGKTLAAFDEASKWMLLGEEAGDTTGTTDDGYLSLGANNKFSSRHTDGSIISFVDGHTKWYRTEAITSNYFQRGGVAPDPTKPTSCP